MSKVSGRTVGALALAAAVLVLGAARVSPSGSHRGALAPGANEACRFPGEEEVRRQSDELDALQRAAPERVVEKHAVAVALVRGDVGLAEAADRFRAIVAGDPAVVGRVRRRHPGASDEQMWCRHVLDFARAAVAFRPDLDRARLDRLEAEVLGPCPGETRGCVPRPR
ncbi:MAG: hypothetical protein J2P46_02880 [Zavarzinella sp.]|nr:hypothetical protein [Zavarzinella sp.]